MGEDGTIHGAYLFGKWPAARVTTSGAAMVDLWWSSGNRQSPINRRPS